MLQPMSEQQFFEMRKRNGANEAKEFMIIPLAVHQMTISISAKYLYGILYGFMRAGVAYCSNEWLMNQLQCKDIKTLRKLIKELEEANCIRKTTVKNRREIECLITEKITLLSDEELHEEYLKYVDQHNAIPSFYRDFVDQVK